MTHARLIQQIKEECKQLQENLQILIEKRGEIERLKAVYTKESAVLTQTIMELSRKQDKGQHRNTIECLNTRSNRNGSPSRKDKENMKGKWNWDWDAPRIK